VAYTALPSFTPSLQNRQRATWFVGARRWRDVLGR
jgi:hypothetical protein